MFSPQQVYLIWIRKADEVNQSASSIVIDLSLINACLVDLCECLWTEITHFQLTGVSQGIIVKYS